jgi:hypothetical protein
VSCCSRKTKWVEKEDFQKRLIDRGLKVHMVFDHFQDRLNIIRVKKKIKKLIRSFLWCWTSGSLTSHDRFGSSSDPSLNGHLHYPNDVDKSLNEAEFIRLLFLQSHRETDRVFTTSSFHNPPVDYSTSSARRS